VTTDGTPVRVGLRWRSAISATLAFLSREIVVVGVIVVVAFVTRFYALGAESLWRDELTTFHRSRMSLPGIVESSQKNHHNPAYFLLMHAWLKLGDSEVMMRAPSAFFGALTIPIGYLLGRVVGGRWVALATAVVLLLNPRLLAYAQEARMYGLFVLGSSISITGLFWLLEHPEESVHPLLGFRRGARRPSRKATLAWLACSVGWAIALYCHATAALFVLSCSVVALVRIVARPAERFRFLASFCIANVLTLLAFVPWLLRLMRQVQVFKETFWAPFPGAGRMAVEFGTVFFYGKSPLRVLFVVLLAIAGTYAIRKKPLTLASLWLLSLLGPGLVVLASFWKPIFFGRQFLWAAVPFGVIVGAGFTAIPRPALRVAALSAVLVAGSLALSFEYYQPYNKERWRESIDFLRSRVRRGDTVMARSPAASMALEYHFTRKTAPQRRFRYLRPRAVEKLPSLRAGELLWVLGRNRDIATVPDTLVRIGWEQADEKAFGAGVVATSFRPPRKAGRRERGPKGERPAPPRKPVTIR
jgi:hypothetical protein